MNATQLIAELAAGEQIIRRLVEGITQAQAQARPEPDAWSVLEVVCHLYDEEREDFRQRLDYTLHKPGESWPPIDPGGWVASRAYNQRSLEDSLAGFLAERGRSLARLRSLQAPDWDAGHETSFGIMKAGDILASWVAHDNLHTRQLVELRRNRLLLLVAPYNVSYAGDW
jgi:DinB superfamily